MIIHPDAKPKLRPLEPTIDPQAGAINVRDPSGLSSVVLSLSEAAFFILTLFDGEHTLADVQGEVLRRYDQVLTMGTLAEMVSRLEESLFLDGPAFEAHYQELVEQYRSAPARAVRQPASLGLDEGAEAVFGPALAEASPPPQTGQGRVAGLIAPHLDYPRGMPCYGSAYSTLAGQDPPGRFVILGTNHFGLGRTGAVVATGLDFATPLGTTTTDRAFLEKLEDRCGNLRRHEYDHAGEHSVELQVCWLQHLFGCGGFTIVPVLCPDPCVPSGASPTDGQGVSLADFGHALAETIAADGQSTVIIAGADFSHVGKFFGDDREFDDQFLAGVRARDEDVLRQVEKGDPDGLRECVAREENPTRICSAGCMFTLMTALPGAQASVLRYHQAVTESMQNCVTCAAVVFRK